MQILKRILTNIIINYKKINANFWAFTKIVFKLWENVRKIEKILQILVYSKVNEILLKILENIEEICEY